MIVAITLLMLVFANYANAETVVEYEQKVCELDNSKGCYNLGQRYRTGTGVKQDDFEAVEYYKKACGLDDGLGCNNLGFMYRNGTGVRQSNQKALEYFGKACDLKEKLGCKNYARLKNQGL